jgi:hypothetical protein
VLLLLEGSKPSGSPDVWVEMFQNNKTMKILDLTGSYRLGEECLSAINDYCCVSTIEAASEDDESDQDWF